MWHLRNKNPFKKWVLLISRQISIEAEYIKRSILILNNISYLSRYDRNVNFTEWIRTTMESATQLTMDTYKCIVCDKAKVKGHSMVTNCTLEAIHSLKDFAKKTVQIRRNKICTTLWKTIKVIWFRVGTYTLSQRMLLVVHKGMLERAEKRFCETSTSELQMRPAKAGRPSTT